MEGKNEPGNRGDWVPGEHDGEDEILRSGQGGGEKPLEYPESVGATSGSTAHSPRSNALTEFKTYRYKGWFPSGRIVAGKEIRAAFVVWLAVYLSLSSFFFIAGLFGIPLEFLDPLNNLDEYGLLRLDLIALVVSVCVLVCRVRSRLAWRKHLLGGR